MGERCECRCLQRPEELDAPEVELTDSCELLDMGARNRTPVVSKSTMIS